MNAVQVAQLSAIARRSGLRACDYTDRRGVRHIRIVLPTHVANYAISPTAAVTGYKVPR